MRCFFLFFQEARRSVHSSNSSVLNNTAYSHICHLLICKSVVQSENMGCGFSRKFVVNDLPGQDQMAMEIFVKFHLSEKDIDLFYTAFCDMDSNGR